MPFFASMSSRGAFSRMLEVAADQYEEPDAAKRRWRKKSLAIGAVCVLGVAGLAVGQHYARSTTSGNLRHVVAEALQHSQCGVVEADIDYVFDVLAGVGHIDNIASTQECCQMCKSESECQAYTWVKDAKLPSGNPGQCWLKGGLLVSKAKKKGVYSALASKEHVSKNKPSLKLDDKKKTSPAKLSAGAKEKAEMERLVKAAEKHESLKHDHVGSKSHDEIELVPERHHEDSALEDKAKKPEDEEERWAEEVLKKKAERLAEKLANEKAEKELRAKAKALMRRKKQLMAKHAAAQEAEARNHGLTKERQPFAKDDVNDKYTDCAARGEGCLKSKCCKTRGDQCYTKNNWWAQCMPECSKGPNPLDQVSPMPWECEELGERTPGTPLLCVVEGENCMESKCCMKAGTTCFAKNATFGMCKVSCQPGADLMADDDQPWTCKKIGSRTVGAAPWVADKCAKNGQNCVKVGCCAEPGHQCYRQDMFYGECKPTCVPGEKTRAWDKAWSCKKEGVRTPLVDNDAEETKGKVGAWVPEKCVADGENCMESQCCKAVGGQCYTKNEYWAACKTSCTSAPDPNDGNATWTCKALGPKSWGLAIKGYPSLYCISLYMPSSYELGLLKIALDVDGGIFACDGFDVYANEPNTIGTTKDGVEVSAILIPKIRVGKSQDGTAGNAKLFMAVWDKVIAAGRFRDFDWTIKVDADAVMLPWRVRDHMRPHVGKNVYVVNCNKYPDSPNFPMMYGSMEIFSGPAMAAYADGSGKCGTQLDWKPWGEDYYMTKCLDFLGVGRLADFGVIGDNVCTGANCEDPYTGAFHPFKDVPKWQECWNQAAAAAEAV